MTNVSVIENQLSVIKKYLKILENYKRFSLEEITQDLTLKGAVERYLYLVTQATIDLAEAIIALKGFRKPTTYSEAFDILKEEDFLPQRLAEKLVKMTGFRNIIAHDYEKIDFSISYDVLQNRLRDIEEFIKKTSDEL